MTFRREISDISAGGCAPIAPDLSMKMSIEFVSGRNTAAVNHLLRLNHLVFKKPGDYAVTVTIDGELEKMLPFFVNEVKKEK